MRFFNKNLRFFQQNSSGLKEESTLTPESVLYKWKGVENFVPVHKVTSKDTHEFFKFYKNFEFFNLFRFQLVVNNSQQVNNSKYASKQEMTTHYKFIRNTLMYLSSIILSSWSAYEKA